MLQKTRKGLACSIEVWLSSRLLADLFITFLWSTLKFQQNFHVETFEIFLINICEVVTTVLKEFFIGCRKQKNILKTRSDLVTIGSNIQNLYLPLVLKINW